MSGPAPAPPGPPPLMHGDGPGLQASVSANLDAPAISAAPVTCHHCHRPILACAAQPSHAGCSSGYGWIHAEPYWGHSCGRASDRHYARPEPPPPAPPAATAPPDVTYDQDAEAWEAAAQAVLNGAFPGLKRELAEAREKVATTQAIARMLQATAIEILAAYESGTVVSGELAGIWRERLGGDHA